MKKKTDLQRSREALAHVTHATRFGSGSLAYRALAYGMRELEARFGDAADLERFCRDLQIVIDEAKGYITTDDSRPWRI